MNTIKHNAKWLSIIVVALACVTLQVIYPAWRSELRAQGYGCGNGVIEPGEECDDGNTVDGDGCSALCTIETGYQCGNGVIEPGEECDDGNTSNLDCCTSQCKFPVKGRVFPISEIPPLPPERDCTVGSANHIMWEMSDSNTNKFTERCTVDPPNNSVEIRLEYRSNDGSCSDPGKDYKLAGQCRYADGRNFWNIEGYPWCLTGSYWISKDPYSGHFTTFDFDVETCETTITPHSAMAVAAASSSNGLTVREYYSPDGPGGALGDILISIETDVVLDNLFLPEGGHSSWLIACDNDGDGDCDLNDLALVQNALGTCEGDPDYNEPADADHDGCVTSTDEEILSSSDFDGDGVLGFDDGCPVSDLSPTVVICGCDSGVNNVLFVEGQKFSHGCTISDEIAKCADKARNHGDFVSCVAHLTNDLKTNEVITEEEKDAIQSCAAQAIIP